MRYRVLGTTLAHHDDGTPVAIGGARLRALLTALAMRPGRTIPVGVLVGEVWEGDPPADGVAALQALIGRLRRALGHGAVSSTDGGYRLCAGEDDIDLYRFGRLAADGARALEAGDPLKASALFADALALWYGPALADLPDRSVHAARWETRRHDARRASLAAALAMGRADQALPELTALCEEFPLDEPLQALRIRALRDVSRTAEALDAYERVRRDLSARLGADPSPELRSLHGELLAGGQVSTPRGASTGGSAGKSQAWQKDAVDDGEPSRGRQAPAGGDRGTGHAAGTAIPNGEMAEWSPIGSRPRGNLRARLTSFVGRDRDIRAIGDDLGRARLVTLLGPGGAGKTRLSQEAAEQVAGQTGGDVWPDGVWLAELAPVDDPETVPEAVLTALHARETVLRGAGAEGLRAADPHAGDPLVLLADHCARRRMLLILDNCEHVIDAAAALAESLLTRCPGLTILATSREPLGVPGETLRPVEPLPPQPAHRLFAERARAVRPDFDTGDDPEAVAEICRRLDGLPLAIELAAARLRSLTPRQIADRLDDRFRLLTSGSRTVLPRQQTLRAVVDWSWDLLDEQERVVLRRLSVFAGGCGMAAAEAVCADGTSHVASRDVAGVLGSLVDKSLVVAVPSTGEGGEGGMRYRLLETVAEYTAQRLDEAADRVPTERRHLVYYRELARTTEPELRGAGQRAAFDRLQREYENLRGALRRAAASRDEHELLCLILSLAWYWQMRDLRAEGRHWAEAAVGLGPDPFAVDVRPAPPVAARCTDAPPPMDPEILAEARREVGLLRLITTDLQAAMSDGLSERLQSVATVYGPGLPQTCRFPGMFWFFGILFTGDGERLMTVVDQTVEACEGFGYEWEFAGVLQLRANMLANRSASAEAAGRDAERALEIYERLGDSWGAAEALSARGESREKRGQFAAAAEDFAAALRHAEGLGVRGHVGLLRARYAQNLIETGGAEEGEKILRDVLDGEGDAGGDAAREVRASGHEVPVTRMFLAVHLGRTGRRQEAREQLELALASLQSDALVVFWGLVHASLAWLDSEDGRYEDARAAARRALESAATPLSRMMAPELSALHLLVGAWALAGLGTGSDSGTGVVEEERERSRLAYDAARLVGAYEALLPEGHWPPPFEREIRERVERATLAALSGDAEAFRAGRAAGGGLSMEEATALV